MRVGIGGVFQETNTYATQWSGPATLERFQVLEGDELLDCFRGTATEVGGGIDAAIAAGAELVPLVFALATPGPTVSAETYAELMDRLITALAVQPHLDALVLVLHGAGVVQGRQSLELDLVARVRAAVGPGIPIVATLDLHSNLPRAAWQFLDLALPYHHYPHTDMGERGHEAVTRAAQLAESGERVETCVIHVPILITAGDTGQGEPMADLLAACRAAEDLPGVLDCSIHHGFPFSDVPEAGAHVSVSVTRASRTDPAVVARDLAGQLWQARRTLVQRAQGAEDAINEAIDLLAADPIQGPIVVNDSSDNPGGGAPGDSTHVLRALVKANARPALLAALTCPATVASAHDAGIGAVIDVSIGGRLGPLQGRPVTGHAVVRALTDGRWRGTTDMGRGAEFDMGRTALVSIDGVDVITCTKPTQVWDPEVLRIHAVAASDYRIVALKSSTHFRAGFSDLARAIVTADPPGLTSLDVSALTRENAGGPLFPLDPDLVWAPPRGART